MSTGVAPSSSVSLPRQQLRTLVIGGALLSIWLVPVWCLSSLFAGPGWQVYSTMLLLIVVGSCCTTKILFPRSRFAPAAVSVIALVSGLVVVHLLQGWGVADWLGDDSFLATAVWQIVQYQAPVPESVALIAMLSAMVGVLVWLSCVVAFSGGMALFAAMLPFMLVLLPSFVIGQQAPAWALASLGGGLAVLYWATAALPVAGFGMLSGTGTALICAIVFAAIMPGSTANQWGLTGIVTAPLGGNSPNLLVELGNSLRSPNQSEAFTHTLPDDATPVRLRLATLADFGRGSWQPQEVADAGEHTLAQDREPAFPGTDIVSEVTISGLVTDRLPLPEGTYLVDQGTSTTNWSSDEWFWFDEDQTAFSPSTRTTRGDRYLAVFAPVTEHSLTFPYRTQSWVAEAGEDGVTQYRVEMIEGPSIVLDEQEYFSDGLTLSATERERYTELPQDVPENISTVADSLADDSEVRTAANLVSYFVEQDFSYSLDVALSETTQTDDTFALIAEFLEQKVGYCVHYASTMAVMARHLGIPSRVVVGYTPGQASSEEGSSVTYSVTNRNLHAWPELFIEDVGWVGYEPTVSVDEHGNTQSGSSASSQSLTPSPEPSPSEMPSSPATPETSSSPGATEQETLGNGDTERSVWDPRPLVVWIIALGVLLIPAAVRVSLRSGRLRAIGSADLPAQAAWREVVDTALDLGYAPATRSLGSLTYTAYANGIAKVVNDPTAIDALNVVVRAVEGERFAPAVVTASPGRAERDELARAVRLFADSLRARASTVQRFCAFAMPRALFRRRASRLVS